MLSSSDNENNQEELKTKDLSKQVAKVGSESDVCNAGDNAFLKLSSDHSTAACSNSPDKHDTTSQKLSSPQQGEAKKRKSKACVSGI